MIARRLALSQNNTSPSCKWMLRSRETAKSIPPSVLRRKRFFCACHWSRLKTSTRAFSSLAFQAGSSVFPSNVSITFIDFLPARGFPFHQLKK